MDTTNWLSDDEMRLWRAFITASSGITSKLDTALKRSHELNLDDYEVLVFLSESPDQRLRMSELSDRLLHSRSRLTQRIDRLANRGFVRREKCQDDQRSTWAILTPEGMTALTAAAPDHLDHVREFFFDHIEPKDVPTIANALEAIVENNRTT